MSHSSGAGGAAGPPGRRSEARRTRLDVMTALAAGLPVLCALALLMVRPDPHGEQTHPPATTPLTAATIVCPSSIDRSGDVAATSASKGAHGHVKVGLGEQVTKATLVSGRVTTTASGTGPAVVEGRGDTAPGLVAGRFGDQHAAATSCGPPTSEQWFTGVGAGARHTSTLELVNPDAGTAIADVTVYGRSGVVNAPRLRGVSVPGRSSMRLDLATLVPRPEDLTLDVDVSRGRLGADVLDRYDQLGAPAPTDEWMPAQAGPSTTNLLLGLPSGRGQRILVVANGGDDEVRADLKLVTPSSVFAPQGVQEIRVPPGGVERVPLTDVLGSPNAKDAIGVEVTASGPVTSTLRSIVAGDLAHTVPGPNLTGPATALLPGRGTATLALAGAQRAGVVTVVARTASGKALGHQRVEVAAGRGATLDLPAGAALVTVTPQRTSISGSIVVTDDGSTVLPLAEPVTSGLVPDVRPGLS